MFSQKILVLGNYRPTVTVIRSLGKAGFYLIVGRGHGRIFTQYSRYTAEIWPHPDMEEAEPDFIEALAALLNGRPDVGFIFPVGETDITCLMRHRDRLPRGPVLVMAEPAVIRKCLDKFRLYEIAASLAIPHAPPRKVTSHAELLSAAEAMGYPCVVKPNDSLRNFFGEKALIVESFADLQKRIPFWPEANDFLVLQKFARGLRHNCHFIADEGRLLGYFEQRVLRTDRQNGTGYGVDTVSCAPTATLREYAAALIRTLNYSGAGCAQFLVNDQDGSANFLELNPRLDATCALPLYCGYDFPRMALLYAAYRHGALSAPPENVSPYPAGKRGVWFWGDLNGWLRAAQTDGLNWRRSLAWLGQAARLPFRGDMDHTWSWADPMPGVYLFAELGLRALKHFARRAVGLNRC